MQPLLQTYQLKKQQTTMRQLAWMYNNGNNFDSSLEKASQGGVSMSELLALLSQIISSAKELRSQVMQSRIDEAKATTDLAIVLADDRRSDAQMKFGISLASSVMNMALTTASSVRIGQNKNSKRQASIKHVRKW